MDAFVVVISAFGGGLAGAVLQPLVGHTLELIRADRVHRKRREQELRRMLRTEMAYGRRLVGVATNTTLMQEFGRDVPMTDRLQRIADAYPRGSLWEPESIRDAELRQLAESYNSVVSSLWREATEERPDKNRCAALADELFAKQRLITKRMDELVWPIDDDLVASC